MLNAAEIKTGEQSQAIWEPAPTPKLRTFVCTLIEQHYHYGAGALLNSLYKAGYRGRAVIGYRGSLPVWAGAEGDGWRCAPGLRVDFVEVRERIHFTNHKPAFMLDLFERYCPEA